MNQVEQDPHTTVVTENIQSRRLESKDDSIEATTVSDVEIKHVTYANTRRKWLNSINSGNENRQIGEDTGNGPGRDRELAVSLKPRSVKVVESSFSHFLQQVRKR